MKKIFMGLIFVSISILALSSVAVSTTVVTESELKDKISSNKISTLFIKDGAIGGLEINQYGLVSDDVVVRGQFKEIPEDIKKLAREHNVDVQVTQGYGTGDDVFWSLIWRIAWKIYYVIIYLGIFVLLFILNKKVSRILKILKRNEK